MTSKLTKERIEWLNYAATGLVANGTEMAMSPQDVIALTEYCLAALDSEPVAYMYDGEDGREYNGHNEFSGGGKGIPLYRHAHPVPDVVGKLLAILDRHTVELGWGEKTITLAELVIARDGSDELNACRASIEAATQEGKP